MKRSVALRSLTLAMILVASSPAASSADASQPADRRSLSAALPGSMRELVDSARKRSIPLVLTGAGSRKMRPLAILLPGYGLGPTDYGYLTDTLQQQGYVVAALQPQRADDPPVPSGDNLLVRRRPYWQRGVDDARFVIRHLQARRIARPGPVLLIGHSHGGDIAMLHAREHGREVSAVFSLDNRRMPMPRVSSPRICSARSSDMPADAGVLPTIAEQARHKMSIIAIRGLKHDDMSDVATRPQKAAVLAALNRCLDGS